MEFAPDSWEKCCPCWSNSVPENSLISWNDESVFRIPTRHSVRFFEYRHEAIIIGPTKANIHKTALITDIVQEYEYAFVQLAIQ